MPSPEPRKYWFPAKRYGWGWGLPLTWQGWAVLVGYIVLVVAGVPVLKATQGTVVYIAYVVLLTVILTVVCWLTGERPRWRWGERDS